MDAEIGAAAGTDLDRLDDILIAHDDGFPGNEPVESVLDHQPVTALAKTFLHNPSP